MATDKAVAHYSAMATEADLRAKLAAFTGHGARPQSGCGLIRLTLAEAEVLVEYEAEAESGDGWHDPHYPARVTVIQALINGQWIDPSEVLATSVIERWEEQIMEALDEAAQVAADDAAEARHRDRMECEA